jgi:hypothetical protein|tara:strand:- start:2909 stop:3514 length:606 start_codon:yes stop_codon:yes gene_type:complete
MNNHEKSEQARSFVRAWTEQNEQLIKTWLNGTKSIEAVGADLIRFMLDASMENGALDLRGIQGPFIESLFRHAPGGEIAARQFFAERIESGEKVPKEFQKLCAELLRGESVSSMKLKPGPDNSSGRRDALILVLTRMLEAKFDLTIRVNDARENDPDFPDSCLEIVRDELSVIEPSIGNVSLKHLHKSQKNFEKTYSWFAT